MTSTFYKITFCAFADIYSHLCSEKRDKILPDFPYNAKICVNDEAFEIIENCINGVWKHPQWPFWLRHFIFRIVLL